MNVLFKLAILAIAGLAFMYFFNSIVSVAGSFFKAFVLDAWLFWVIILVLLLHELATPRL